MTDLASNGLDVVIGQFGPALAGLVDAFGVPGLEAGPADEQHSAGELVPEGIATWIHLPGSGIDLLLVVSDLLAQRLGVPDAEAMGAAAMPLVGAAASAFGIQPSGAQIVAGDPSQLDPSLGLGADRAGRRIVGAGIFLEGAHVATLAVSTPDAADASYAAPFEAPAPAANPAAGLGGVGGGLGGGALDLLRGVEMSLTAELGRTSVTVGELLGMVPGEVVELDRSAGGPIDLLVNGTLLARGEVVVVDDQFAVRITEIVSNQDGLG